MNPTETQLTTLADLFSGSTKSESTFKGYKIVVEEFGSEYDYEIFTESFYNTWEFIHGDVGFGSREEARKAGEGWIKNWDSSDDMWEQ